MENKIAWTFGYDDFKISTTNIDRAKEYAIAITESNTDLPKQLHDIIFAIELAYQKYYNLDEDNWDMVHEYECPCGCNKGGQIRHTCLLDHTVRTENKINL